MSINELKQDILTKFKTLNNITDTTKDDILNIYIDRSIQDILNLTNRTSSNFPEELEYVILDMLNDFYYTSIQKIKELNDDNNFISSISEEGRSVNYGNLNNLGLDSLISNHISNNLLLRQKQINRYRLLYKVVNNEQD